jgi:hypothetical protein
MSSSDAAAVTGFARLFIAIGLGLAVLGGRSGFETYSFISESVLAEGTVVDWAHGRPAPLTNQGPTIPSSRSSRRVEDVSSVKRTSASA